jgi:CBS domain-containing protein
MNRAEAKRRRLQSILAASDNPRADWTVEQVMTSSPITVEPDTSALDLAQLFYSLKVRHFPVKDEAGKLIGMVSDREMVRCFGITRDPTDEELAQVTVSQLMSAETLSVQPGSPVLDALSIMLNTGVNALPVTAADEKLVGIVTSTDLFVLLEILLDSAQSDSPLEPQLQLADAER